MHLFTRDVSGSMTDHLKPENMTPAFLFDGGTNIDEAMKKIAELARSEAQKPYVIIIEDF
jgi:hypothetical protein